MRLFVGDTGHLGHQGALRQTLLVDAQRVDQFVVEDRVVHPHATLVEDPDDGLVAHELSGERPAQLDLRTVARVGDVTHVVGLVRQSSGLKPSAQAARRPVIGEVLAPQRRVGDPGLGEAAGEIQQPHQAGELAAPVGHDEDRTAVAAQPGQHVVAVLPDAFHYGDRCVRGNVLEHLDTRALAVDEAVPLLGVERVPTLYRPAQCLDGGREVSL